MKFVLTHKRRAGLDHSRMQCVGAMLVLTVLSPQLPVEGQLPDSLGDPIHKIHFRVAKSRTALWEEAVQATARNVTGGETTWLMFQTDLSEYFLVSTASEIETRSMVVDGFIGGVNDSTLDPFLPLSIVRYDVTRHEQWRKVPHWSVNTPSDPFLYPWATTYHYEVRSEMLPAVDEVFRGRADVLRAADFPYPMEAMIDARSPRNVLVVFFTAPGAVGAGGESGLEEFLAERGYGARWEQSKRDLARLAAKVTMERGRYVPELSRAR